MKNSKLIIAILFAGVAAYTVLSGVDLSEADISEYSGICGDDVYYEFDTVSGTLSITGSGTMYDYSSKGNVAPWNSYSNLIKTVDIGASVKSIGEYSFYNCISLTSVSISETVLSIRSGAFQCCFSLRSIVIPDSVRSISTFSFFDCTSLESITIPASVTDLSSAFRGCTSLTSIDVDENNMTYSSVDGVLFNKKATYLIEYPAGKPDLTYTIPETVTTVGAYAFYGCVSVTSVTVPDSVDSFGKSAFDSCSALASINIPASVRLLSDYMFSECTALASVSFSGPLESIEMFAFFECTSLESITLPDTVLSLDIGSFKHCTSLASIVIPDSVISLGGDAFTRCRSLTSLTLSNSISSIQSSTFSQCSSLTSIVIPDSVTSIGNYAFDLCASLTSVTLPESLTSIGYDAFWKCTSLESIVIPDSVTEIGRMAFNTCTSLTSVTLGKSLTSIGYAAFYNCDSLELFEVSGDNPAYSSEDGVLFDKGMTVLIQCPVCKTGDYAIPDTVVSVGLSAFRYCSMLTSLTIPDSVTSIGEGAFYGCAGLTELTVPADLDCVAYTATPVFVGCVNIEKVTFTGSGNWFPYGSFYSYTPWQLSSSVLDTVIISDGVLSVGKSAFAGCTALSTVVIPDSVQSLGEGAFCGCTGLTDLTVPAGLDCVVSTKNSVFEGCVNVRNITFAGSGDWYSYGTSYLHTPWQLSRYSVSEVIISEGVLSVGDFAFAGCTSLSSVVIPGSVIYLGESSFRNCTGLTELTVPAGLDCVGSNENPVFEGCVNIVKMVFTGNAEWYGYDTAAPGHSGSGLSYYGYTPWQLSRADLSTVVIVGGVRSIGDSAFRDCSKLVSVVIPDSVTALGKDVFSGCTSLYSMVIVGGNPSYSFSRGVLFSADRTVLIEYLPGNANRTYTVPSTVAVIGDNAFSGCTSLTTLTIPCSVTSIGISAFDGDFYDSDGVTMLEPAASDLAGHTFVKTDGRWVKQVSSSAGSGPEGIWIVCVVLAIFVVGTVPAVIDARRSRS